MTHATTLRRLAAAALLTLAGTSQAAIVNGANVGGFRTFVDTSTGTIWADLDNHLGPSSTGPGFSYRFADRADYMSSLLAAGFTWATVAQVSAFTATVPMPSTTEFYILGEIMGSMTFEWTMTLDGYADAGDSSAQRVFVVPDPSTGPASWALSGVTTLPNALNDSGLWAFIAGPAGPGGGGSVPVPGTLALAGLGLAALAGRRRATA
jgi:hypothetical protein